MSTPRSGSFKAATLEFVECFYDQTGGPDGVAGSGTISAVSELAASNPAVLGPTETHLLQEWLRKLKSSKP